DRHLAVEGDVVQPLAVEVEVGLAADEAHVHRAVADGPLLVRDLHLHELEPPAEALAPPALPLARHDTRHVADAQRSRRHSVRLAAPAPRPARPVGSSGWGTSYRRSATDR